MPNFIFIFFHFQILIVAIVIVATFVIPISHLNQLHSGWIFATLVGNCLFIVLQMVCLIDSTGSICKNLDKIATRSRWWAFVEVKYSSWIVLEFKDSSQVLLVCPKNKWNSFVTCFQFTCYFDFIKTNSMMGILEKK